jgi:hypothetical protein
MPTFKPPWGPRDLKQHVFSPAHHLGYRYIVAYLMDGPSKPDYIVRACSDAHAEGAPKDAVCRNAGEEWTTRGQIGRTFGHRLDDYARALTKYEEDLAAERRPGA